MGLKPPMATLCRGTTPYDAFSPYDDDEPPSARGARKRLVLLLLLLCFLARAATKATRLLSGLEEVADDTSNDDTGEKVAAMLCVLRRVYGLKRQLM